MPRNNRSYKDLRKEAFLCVNRRYVPGSDCEQIRVREQTV